MMARPDFYNLDNFVSPCHSIPPYEESTSTSTGLNSMLLQCGQHGVSITVRPDSPGNRWRCDGLVSSDILAS